MMNKRISSVIIAVICLTAAPSSGQSSGSGTPQTPANSFDYQQLRDRIRVPPAYKPGL
ncbi:MAG: hypothetical protein AB9903_16790 [Vulcanimicrobiota bacterium]